MNAWCRNGRRQPGSQVQRRQLAKKSLTSLARRQGSARQSRLYVDETPARTGLRRGAVVTRGLVRCPGSASRCSAREVVALVVVVGKSAVRRVLDASDRGISESRVPAPHDRFAHRVRARCASASATSRWLRAERRASKQARSGVDADRLCVGRSRILHAVAPALLTCAGRGCQGVGGLWWGDGRASWGCVGALRGGGVSADAQAYFGPRSRVGSGSET